MDDKTFELMEKMYLDINKKLEKINDNIIEVREDLGNRISKVEMKMENDISCKIGALFEARDTTNDKLERIENKIDYLTDKVETHDIKIQVIEGGKKKKKSI